MANTYAWNSEIASTTKDIFLMTTKKLADNVTKYSPFANIFLGGKTGDGKLVARRKPKRQIGGKQLLVPLRYGHSATVQTVGEGETVQPMKIKGIGHATFNWKYAIGHTVITWQDKQQNSGQAQVISMINDLMDDLKTAFVEKIDTMLVSDGTGNGGKDMLGLAAFIERDPTSSTLGGISKANNTWWRNWYWNAIPGASSFNSAFATSNQGLKDMLYMWLACGYKSKGAGSSFEKPDFCACSLNNYAAYEIIARDLKRFNDIAGDANLGFDTLKFKNTKLFYVPALDDGPNGSNVSKQMWFNTKHLYMIIDPNYYFKGIPWENLGKNQPMDDVAYTTLVGQMVCDNLSRLGYLEWTSDTN